MSKKLYKSTTDRKLCGVCAGIANYLNIDPTVVRLLWALITFLGGAGVIAYIVCALVIPDEPYNNNYQDPYYAPTDDSNNQQ
ncbi:PspC domain-containing protein [Eubacterium coprostanoligenes]|mgnify:FL=1|uniref:PspC domain-containing protein n=1 Tax=Eubacterium coprostanoligenes TaxID=290054 RepID=UPI0015AE1703|nr:PspC domain-containing protein [Eubacterium coprostanoligenes]MCI6253298.1 PspC domain-containing protein [Eubacterium coprostanoligenes]MCI6360523.1 PspC domain-containing protein [Eubacterium coprostanoligenes]MDD7358457.1 PspC domain-containing protein [Eubacterium coprostanoligenes]MDY4699184.1 PspC domain-containing protein [Eubacterium coprostanoligenes]MDY5400418.1 PspC domain-containing protein [Eubacterium coprostanoligenes]